MLVAIDARPNIKIKAISHKQFVEYVGTHDVPGKPSIEEVGINSLGKIVSFSTYFYILGSFELAASKNECYNGEFCEGELRERIRVQSRGEHDGAGREGDLQDLEVTFKLLDDLSFLLTNRSPTSISPPST